MCGESQLSTLIPLPLSYKMSQLVLERGTTFRRSLIKRLIPARVFEFKLSPYFLIVSLVVSVCLITLITLMSSTNEITKGYTLDKLDDEQQELVKQREIKDMKLSQVRALDAIRSSNKVQRMVRPNNIAYVVDTGNVVVKK